MTSETIIVENKETEPETELIIRPQTPEEEYNYLWFVLKGILFYQQNGYTYEIPTHHAFQTIIETSPNFDPNLKNGLFPTFKDEIYDLNYFEAGLKALESQRYRIVQAFPRFKELHSLWGFKIFPQYHVTVTRYGPGGMYLEDEGRVIMMTRLDGTFKRPHPTHTAVHEMVHMGIEDNIVKRYGLRHWEKERLVDRICLSEFGHILPGYQFQARGEVQIDPYVTPETIDELPLAIERYIKDFPRTKQDTL